MSRSVEVAAVLGGAALAGVGLAPFLHREPEADAWFRLHWPRDLDEQRALALLRHLASTRRPNVITFEVRAREHKLVHLIGVANADAERLRHSFGTFLPDVLLEPVECPTPHVARAVELRLGSRERALRTDASSEVARSVLAAMAGTSGVAVLQCRLGTRLSPSYVSKDSHGLPTVGRALGQAFRYGLAPLDATDRRNLQNKIGEQGFRVALLIGTNISDRLVGKGVLRTVIGGLRVAEAPGVHFTVRRADPGAIAAGSPPRRFATACNVTELIGLLAWPLGDDAYAGVARIASRRLPVPARVPSIGRVIGIGNHPQTLRPVAQPIADACMGTWLLAPTGTGKSTLISHLIAADIADGRGALIVDPKGGDLVEDVLTHIPKHRLKDIVVCDPSDVAPVGINPLAGRSAESAADTILTILHGIFGRDLGPRSTDIIYASVAAMAEQPGGTLAAVPVLLSNAEYRRRVTKRIDDPTARSFWQWFEQLSTSEQANVTSPVGNKLRVLTRPSLRAVLSQPEPRFDIREVFDNNKILLVALDHATLGNTGTAMLGSIIVAEAWRAIQARSRVPKAHRRQQVIYLDEWQLLAHGIVDIGDAMARSRGYGVGWCVANQSASQLEPQLRHAALVNARTKLVWTLPAEDAALLARTTEQLDAHDFQSLGRYESYCSLVVDGEVQPFFSLTTQPLGPAVSVAEEVKTLSRQRYGVDRQETEAAYRALWQQPGEAGRGDIGSRLRRGERTEESS